MVRLTGTPLLPSDALRGSRVGISLSQSPDLARLGLRETHFKLTLGEIARAVLVSGGGLVWGGKLGPDGHTTFVVTESQRYARPDRPLLVCLAWHEHRRLPLGELLEFKQRLSLYGRLVCLDLDGTEVALDHERGGSPEIIDDVALRRRALTGLRRYMMTQERGRVFLGGRRTGFQGAIPGLMEEALVGLRAGRPLYLAGGLGGVTLDIVRALGVDNVDWLPPDPDALPDDPGLRDGYGQLEAVAAEPGFTGLANGLTDEENRWLATSHRPGEIAALVSLGLGRLELARGASAPEPRSSRAVFDGLEQEQSGSPAPR
jgi:hypothetical protein